MLTDYIIQHVRDKFPKKEYPYGRQPGHYLWEVCQRVNLLTEFYTFEEQEEILNHAYQMEKIPPYHLDKSPDSMYNSNSLNETQYHVETLV